MTNGNTEINHEAPPVGAEVVPPALPWNDDHDAGTGSDGYAAQEDAQDGGGEGGEGFSQSEEDYGGSLLTVH